MTQQLIVSNSHKSSPNSKSVVSSGTPITPPCPFNAPKPKHVVQKALSFDEFKLAEFQFGALDKVQYPTQNTKKLQKVESKVKEAFVAMGAQLDEYNNQPNDKKSIKTELAANNMRAHMNQAVNGINAKIGLEIMKSELKGDEYKKSDIFQTGENLVDTALLSLIRGGVGYAMLNQQSTLTKLKQQPGIANDQKALQCIANIEDDEKSMRSSNFANIPNIIQNSINQYSELEDIAQQNNVGGQDLQNIRNYKNKWIAVGGLVLAITGGAFIGIAALSTPVGCVVVCGGAVLLWIGCKK